MSAGGAPPTPPDHNVLKPSTLRAWRVATGVAVVFTGFQLVLRTDYGDRDHVFKPIQRWYTEQIDAWLGVDSEVARRLKAPTLSLAAHQQEKVREEQQKQQQADDVARALANARAPANAVATPAAAPVAEPAPAAQAAGGGGGWGRWFKWW